MVGICSIGKCEAMGTIRVLAVMLDMNENVTKCGYYGFFGCLNFKIV